MAGADVVDHWQVIADSAGDCKKAPRRRLLKEKYYRNKIIQVVRICVKLALRTP
jgi:hypothetical protein